MPYYSHVANPVCRRSNTAPDFSKNAGQCQDNCGAMEGNPIHSGTGNKYQKETDYSAAGGSISLTLSRSYNSSGDAQAAEQFGYGATSQGNFGRRWRSNFHRDLIVSESVPGIASVIAVRGDGKNVYFSRSGTNWNGEPDISDQLIEITTSGARLGWKYLSKVDRSIEWYDPTGKLTAIDQSSGLRLTLNYSDGSTPVAQAPRPGLLLQITDSFGRALRFTYNSSAMIVNVTDAANQTYEYSYDNDGRLLSVTFPDGKKRSYLYDEPVLLNGTDPAIFLTGITDENGIRIGTYSYNGLRRASTTERAGGVDKRVLTYIGNTSETLDALGTKFKREFQTIYGIPRPTQVTRVMGGTGLSTSQSFTYDTQGNRTSRTDFNNTKTCYSYDLSRNLETHRIEGLPGAAVCAASFSNPPADARLITTQWHPDWRLETRRAEPGLITTSVYNGQGAVCAPADALVDGKPIAVVCRRTEQATTDESGALGFAASPSGPARTTSFTYNRWGQVLTSNGPRGDASDTLTYSYYPDTQANWTLGDLRQISNGLGHVTRFTRYNRHGQVLERVDPNGLVTQYSYDLRQRLTRVQAGDEVNTYAYDAVGNLIKATLPEGGSVTYTYDPAHRLVAIQDPQGNRIDYTLDAMGNRIAEKTTDVAGVLRGNITRTMDALNRVQKVVGGD